MNSFGKNFIVSIFGESHGKCIGCTISGIPAGFKPNWDLVKQDLAIRTSKKSVGSTQRTEDDEFELVSGLYNDRTTGMPLTAIFKNKDAHSEDYSNLYARPSHADYAAYVKYKGFNDNRGGGAFSGRLTVALVFAGAIAKQLLFCYGVRIRSHILRIGSIVDEPFDSSLPGTIENNKQFPLIEESKRKDFEDEIKKVRQNGDSVGGIVESCAVGLPVGIGEPFFDSAESIISHLVFSIPGVKGIEFGDGFSFANSYASMVNDNFGDEGKTLSNHSGGINGGLTNGMPLIFRTVFKPIPSISIEQTLFDLKTKTPLKGTIVGRHDACILPRGYIIVESCFAIALYDLMLQAELNGDLVYGKR